MYQSPAIVRRQPWLKGEPTGQKSPSSTWPSTASCGAVTWAGCGWWTLDRKSRPCTGRPSSKRRPAGQWPTPPARLPKRGRGAAPARAYADGGGSSRGPDESARFGIPISHARPTSGAGSAARGIRNPGLFPWTPTGRPNTAWSWFWVVWPPSPVEKRSLQMSQSSQPGSSTRPSRCRANSRRPALEGFLAPTVHG